MATVALPVDHLMATNCNAAACANISAKFLKMWEETLQDNWIKSSPGENFSPYSVTLFQKLTPPTGIPIYLAGYGVTVLYFHGFIIIQIKLYEN